MKPSDAFTLPGGGPPEIRLFSPFQIGVATFLGNVFAGGALLAINYWRLGRSRPAWVAIVSSAVLAIGTLFAVVLTNILVSFVLYSCEILGIYYLAKRIQGTDFDHHVGQGGQLGSRWEVIGVAVGAAVLLIVIYNVVIILKPDLAQQVVR